MAATVDRGKNHTIKKLRVIFYLETFLSTIAWETACQIGLRNFSKQVREEPGYTQVFAGKKETQLVEHQTPQWLTAGSIHCLLEWGVFVCSVMSSCLQTMDLARQASLSMGFPGKNTGVGCHSLLQGIFPTQESSPCLLCLLNLQANSLPLTPPGKQAIFFFFGPHAMIWTTIPPARYTNLLPHYLFLGKKLWCYLCIQLCGIFECTDFSSCSDHRGNISFSPGNVGLSCTTVEMTSLVLFEMLTVVLDLLNFPWKVHILVASVLISQYISTIPVLIE